MLPPMMMAAMIDEANKEQRVKLSPLNVGANG